MIEESIMVLTLDDHCPQNWSDAALDTISGDLHSKWADKSCGLVAFRNGRFGSIGEVKLISRNLCRVAQHQFLFSYFSIVALMARFLFRR